MLLFWLYLATFRGAGSPSANTQSCTLYQRYINLNLWLNSKNDEAAWNEFQFAQLIV